MNKIKCGRKNNLLFLICILFFVAYFGFWWLFKLSTLPGLHGDEAWFGLQGVSYNENGIDSLHGMNNYTGILESLMTSTFFKFFGVGVLQLRIGGVVANCIALCILGFVFIQTKEKRAFVVFLFLLSQSTLYMISPRIAWEVNSFTLLFITLEVLSVTRLLKSGNRLSFFWSMVFLLNNVIGSYNHIIFSGISLAGFMGILFWRLYIGTNKFSLFLPLLAFNTFNVFILFFFTYYYPLGFTFVFSILVILLLIISECLLMKFMNGIFFFKKRKKIPSLIVFVLLNILLLNFCIYHGQAFFATLSNYKLITHVYSLQFPKIVRFLFIGFGIVLVGLLLFYSVTDLKKRNIYSLYVFIIVVYLGLVPFYTNKNSFRYYLIGYAMCMLYLAIKLASDKVLFRPVLCSILLSMIVFNISLVEIFFDSNRKFMATEIEISKKMKETSAHFLPNKPLIKFLKENKIGNVYILTDSYFLRNVIDFYKLSTPWVTNTDSQAIIGYDYSSVKNGGYILIRN